MKLNLVLKALDRGFRNDTFEDTRVTQSAFNRSSVYATPSVVLLTNFLPPYRIAVLKAVQARLPNFSVLISTQMENNRSWSPEYKGLNVAIQKNVSFTQGQWHPKGFRDDLNIHIPYDTLWRLLRARPEVVITGELGVRTVFALLYRKLQTKSRLIVWATVSEASEAGRGKLRQFVRSGILSHVDAVLVNGASGARYVARFGVPKRKIFIAPYTSDIRPLGAILLQRGYVESRRLLYVGQLIERKGLIPFLSVLSSWAKAHATAEVEFWIVGDGAARTALQEVALPPNLVLHFFGNVPYEKVETFYAQAGILVLPTLADEWGLVVNEAMASGLPVLGSLYSQAVQELVEDGVTGWTFHPDRADEMYTAVDRALSTGEDRLEEMRVSATTRVEYLTPDYLAERILEAIHFVRPDLEI